MIGAAGVGGLEVAPAEREHGRAAVAALEEAGVDVLVYLDAAIVVLCPLLAQGPDRGEGAVVHDGLVVVFDDDLLHLVAQDVPAVYLGALVFALAQRTDVEVVVEYGLDGDDAPRALHAAVILLALGELALALGHARRGYALVGEGVRDLLVAPAVDVHTVDAANNVGLDRHDLELLLLVDDVAVGRGADPLSVLLTAADDAFDLLARVRDGHLVYKELELYFKPVVVVREVDAVAYGDDARARVAQVFELHEPAAVAAREA